MLLKSYYNRCVRKTLDQSTTGQEKWVEITVGEMLAAYENNDRILVEKRRSELIDSFNKYETGWMEKPYGKKDLDHGTYGSVTTAFTFYGLLITDGKSLIKGTPKSEVGFILNRVADRLYGLESNGHIVKNSINRSRVYNTNLLVASVLGKYIYLLPSGSVRRKLFEEMVRRIIYRAISDQLPSGAFRYHSLSLDCPLLYQAMCLSLLGTLAEHTENQELVRYRIAKGFKWLDRHTNKDGMILWHTNKSKDKVGSCWVYGWTIPIYFMLNRWKSGSQVKYLLSRFGSMDGISDDGSELDKEQPQELYLALSILSIHLCKGMMDIANVHEKMDWRATVVSKVLETKSVSMYLCAIIKQSAWRCKQRLIFKTGALENETW